MNQSLRRALLTTVPTFLVLSSTLHASEGDERALAIDDLVAQVKQRSQPTETPALTLDAAATAPAADTAPAWEKGAPLPFHTIEGYGGGAITPMAYLVNPGKPGDIFGKPSVAFSYVNLGSKNLEAFTLTETLFGRVELGFGADRLDLGNTPGDIKRVTNVDIGTHDVWLYNFNTRVLVLPENSFNTKWLPAITIGSHFKYNSDIGDINKSLGGALSSIGYHHSSGEDLTLTATKMFPKLALGRPVIVTGGWRESQAANLGFLGFGQDWSGTFEGNIAILPTDWLLVAYEFRQKEDPYGRIPGLINGENNWHAVDVSWIINKNATLVAGWGNFGTLGNSEADGAWWLQLKYEF
ncbi:MAG: DUF3034 family protein [Phycisphaerae bacterium]